MRGVRARILIYAVMLLVLGIAVTVFTVRQILLVRLDSRVNDSLTEEAREFRTLAAGADPRTGRSFEQVEPLFDLYLSSNVPGEDEQVLTFSDGTLYRSEGVASGHLARATGRWDALDSPRSGVIDAPGGPVQYLAVPVSSRSGNTNGTLVVGRFTGDERDEIQAAVTVAGIVGAIVALLGSLVAYLAAGRVLSPLRELTETARAIQGSDLTRRIEVQGDDELAELGRTFNAMLDRLEAAFASQRELIRDVSHELRTPITIVRGHLELMGDDRAEREETIELVTDELDRMGRLVDDLLTLARAERPDFLRPEPIELGELVSEIHAKASSLGERNWSLVTGSNGTVMADRQRLTQALINLADNAIKQTGPGAGIELGAEHDDDVARIWVADEGSGLGADERASVFRRFARGSAGERYAGTGLGLAIVKAIAEAHGGSVELESEPGSGARFTIVLPVARAEHRAAEDVR